MNSHDDDDDDFGALLEESLRTQRKRLAVGDRVKATVMQVGRENVILDLGDGRDGIMDVRELGEKGADLKEGDALTAYVLRFEDRVAELGLRMGRGDAAGLQDARESGVPIEGTVVDVNKGGYVVEAFGVRAFCPLGAMDVRRIDDPKTMIGRKLLFRVTEMKGPRDAVLSRRVLLDEENARRAQETRGRLSVGATVRGVVTNVREFGAFVDLGGLEGLVPAGEIAFGRVKAEEAIRPGQEVEAQVLRMEAAPDGRERITLSMKALLEDPFAATVAELGPGTIVAGTVTRVQPFGAFVELVPGVEGLVHVSAFGKRVGHPSDVVKAGQRVAVRVEGIDAEARRIALHLADAAELPAATEPASGLVILRRAEPVAAGAVAGAVERERAPAPRLGDVVDVTVDRVESYGAFVSWPQGRGLVPGRELGLPRGGDVRRQIQPGAQFRATIVDVREDGKITLSRTAVERAEERADADAYLRTSRSQGSGLGTLGDLMADPRRRRRM